MYRHSLQRPRDIMEMSLALYEQIVKNPIVKQGSGDVKQRTFRHWINQTSTSICRGYINFLEPFIAHGDNIKFAQEIVKLAQTLPTNVFTKETMDYYCHNLNHNDKDDTVDCLNCEKYTIFQHFTI